MLRRYTKLTADVMADQFLKKRRIFICHYIIKPHSGTDKYFFYPRNLPELPKKRHIVAVICRKILQGVGKGTADSAYAFVSCSDRKASENLP